MKKLFSAFVLLCMHIYSSEEPLIKRIKISHEEVSTSTEEEHLPLIGLVQELFTKTNVVTNHQHEWNYLLFRSVEEGDLAACLFILENNLAQINVANEAGLSPLIIAARKGHTHICRYLLAKNATVDARDTQQRTALMWAASGGHLETCIVLLKAGAQIHARAGERSTPLMYATIEGHKDICKLLLSVGADLSHSDEYGHTALTLACQEWEPETCQSLISNATFIPHRPPTRKIRASLQRLRAALLVFSRLHLFPRELQLYILQSTPELRTDLARVFVALIYSGHAPLIPLYYRFIVGTTLAQETIKRLKPLMREALLYAHTDELRNLLDDTSLEEHYGTSIAKSAKEAAALLTQRPSGN